MVELHLNDEKRCLIKVGDKIEFTGGSDKNNTFLCEVVALHTAPDFETLCAKSVTPRRGGFDTAAELFGILKEF